MKRLFLFLIAIFCYYSIFSQYYLKESNVYFPDIEGYYTLKCDFHTHTVFSDGLVWPSYRVIEAIHDGLDVISITDHIEYTPHKNDINIDFNRAYEIAKETGDNLGVVVIPGAEITRSMPPGHLNVLFITDANKLNVEDVNEAIEEASKQGAFIFWNHPCWPAQQPDTINWFDIHTDWYNKEYLHGIEIHNFSWFCNEGWLWALEKKLTILSNSDIHSTTQISSFKDHRPMTLVFSRSRNLQDIKDALFAGRTLTYSENTIRGEKDLLEQLFHQCLIKKSYFTESGRKIIEFTNISSVPIKLKSIDKNRGLSSPENIEIPPKGNFRFFVETKKEHPVTISYQVENFLYEPEKYIIYSFDIKQ